MAKPSKRSQAMGPRGEASTGNAAGASAERSTILNAHGSSFAQAAVTAPPRKRLLSNSVPSTLSFQELQRLNAMKMEIFGFAGWLASTLFYVLFLMWAYLPDSTLRSYGLTYLPSKHWAVAVPAMIVMSYLFSIVLYKAINMKWTPTLDSYATVCDVHSVFLEDDALNAHAEAETPPIADIPLTQVNSYLYS